MRTHFDNSHALVISLKKKLLAAEAAIRPPFSVSYMVDDDEKRFETATDLGKFETEEAVYAAVEEDLARRTGIDLDTVKMVQYQLGRYSVTPCIPF